MIAWNHNRCDEETTGSGNGSNYNTVTITSHPEKQEEPERDNYDEDPIPCPKRILPIGLIDRHEKPRVIFQPRWPKGRWRSKT